MKDSFVLGVNYWPRKKAMYWWKDFDRTEVENEFAQIAALKLQVARIFLFWEDFQPTVDTINVQALNDLGTVLEIAQEAGIQIMPTFFTGHMSGINWWPKWALLDKEQEGVRNHRCFADGEETLREGRDPYTDPLMLAAERRLIAAVSGRFGDHPAIYSWNFSNEPDLFYTPKTYDDGAKWNAFVASEVRKYSNKPVSAGMHIPTICGYSGFRPDQLAPSNDFLSMHGYSIYYGPTAKSDPMNSDVVPLFCLATEALGGKRVLFEEFGYASSEKGDVSEFQTIHRRNGNFQQYFADDAAGGKYYSEVLEKLARCGALGAFGWMFCDYDPSLWNKPPFDTHVHERFFGLTRYDGTIKPAGEAMRAFAERIEAGELPQRDIAPLKLDPDAWYQDSAGNFERLFREWTGKL